jgi:hypothetical protein
MFRSEDKEKGAILRKIVEGTERIDGLLDEGNEGLFDLSVVDLNVVLALVENAGDLLAKSGF